MWIQMAAMAIFLVSSVAAFLASRSSLRREKAFSNLRVSPPSQGFSWSVLRRGLGGEHKAVKVERLGYPFALALGLVILSLGGNLLLGILPLLAMLVLRRTSTGRGARRARHKEDEQVLELIDSLNQSLRSGLSLQQSLETAADDVGDELRGKIMEILKDLRLGSGLEEALAGAASSSNTPSLKLTFTVLGLLHGKGGDLPRILERLRKRVSEGLEVRREARILTSQSRASGYLLSALPAVFLLLQAVLNPRSLTTLFQTQAGNIIIAAAVGFNAAAFLLIRRIVDPEV